MTNNIKTYAIDLLQIESDFQHRNMECWALDFYDLYVFSQTWGNTSGGFESWGGSAITTQTTCVIITTDGNTKNRCYVYFNGKYAYDCPYSDVFVNDLKENRIAGLNSCNKYYIKKN